MPIQVNELHPFQLDVAFAQLKRQQLEEKKLVLVTADSSITTSSSNLLLFSPWLRSILSSIPCSSSNNPTTILIPDISTASLKIIIDLISLGSTSSKCKLKEVIRTVGDARLLNIDISNLVEVAAEEEVKEDKQALRESLRLEKLADEEQARVERVENENQERLSRVENLLQRVRTELTDGDDSNVGTEVADEDETGPRVVVDSNTGGVDPNTHECQKCGQLLPEASIEMWEHYTNHYKAAILRSFLLAFFVFFEGLIHRDFGALHKGGRCIKCFKSFTEQEVCSLKIEFSVHTFPFFRWCSTLASSTTR